MICTGQVSLIHGKLDISQPYVAVKHSPLERHSLESCLVPSFSLLISDKIRDQHSHGHLITILRRNWHMPGGPDRPTGVITAAPLISLPYSGTHLPIYNLYCIAFLPYHICQHLNECTFAETPSKAVPGGIGHFELPDLDKMNRVTGFRLGGESYSIFNSLS